MKYLRTIITVALMLAVQTAAIHAVTDKEMEEARAYTAKSYLRYVNNGSGYLDDVNAKTMAELNSKLKAKEKENIAAFNAVKVPTDYASWDKKRLVEYWAATFFTSPGLDPNGKAARTRVRKYIEGMTISAATPQPASDAKPAEEKPQKAAAAAPVPAATSEQPEDGQLAPADVVAEEPADILADQKEIEKAAEESRDTRPQEQSRTWVYVLVLAILVGIVIWLVVYAANLMKRQPGADGNSTDSSAREPQTDAELREQTRKAIAAKNQELQQMQERLTASEARVAELSNKLESEHRERLQLEDHLNRMRTQKEVQAAAQTVNQAAAQGAAQALESGARQPAQGAQQGPRVIFLGRANRRGIFVRADRKITAGSTIYQLETNDGLVGTFHVVDRPEVVELAMTDPTEYLSQGCTGEDLEDTAGVTRITTRSAGTAIFENGYWKVLRKTRIQYE